MPSYQDIFNRHSAAVANGHIDPTTPLEEYARQGAQATGDPSWMDVAEGGPVKNWIRTKNAQLNNAIEAGPVDDWSAATVGQVGDLFGIDPQVSREVGRKFPRGVVDFIPMAAGSAVGGAIGLLGGPGGAAAGATIGGDIGLGLTSGLSALNAYGETGKVLDAGIGAIAPTVGTKLSSMGTKAILANAAKPGSYLGRLGFTGGTKIAGQALTAEEQLALAASKQFGTLSAEALAKTTVDKTVVDLARDKFLGYVGGEAAANAGFTGLDIVTQGSDAVFNKNYLFANLISNVPFMAAEIPGAFRNQELNVQYNLPTAEKAYSSAAEQRAHETALMFQGLDSAAVLKKYREEGLDVADYVKGFQELSVALNERENVKATAGPEFVKNWNDLVAQFPEAVVPPITGETNIASLIRTAASKDSNLPAQFVDLASAHKNLLAAADSTFRAQVNKLSKIQDISVKKLQENYQLLSDKVNLGPLMEKPVTERSFDDYKAALAGQLSDKGIDFIRDYHRVLAGEAPESTAWAEYQQMRTDAGKVAYSPDQQFELTVAHAIATGNVPDFNVVAKKAKEAQESGATPVEVARAAQAALEPKRTKPAGLEKLSYAQIEDLTSFRQELDQLPPVGGEPNLPQDTMRYIKAMAQSLEGSLAPRGISNFLLAAKREVNATGKPLQERVISIDKLVKNAERGPKLGSTRESSTPQIGDKLNEGLVEPVEVKGGEANKDEVDARAVEDGDPLGEVVAEQDEITSADDVIEESEARAVAALAEGRDWNGFWSELSKTRFKAKAGNKLYAEFVESYVESLSRTTTNPLFDWKKTAKKFMEATEADQVKLARLQKEKDASLKLAATGDPRVPTPDAPVMQVRAFADAIAGNMEWIDPISRSRFVEDLPKIARLFNNPEVVYGELGIAPKKRLTYSTEPDGEHTFIHDNGIKIEGKTTTNLSQFPTGKESQMEGPAFFNSREAPGDRKNVERLIEATVENVRRIGRVTIPDSLKGQGVGKELILKHLEAHPDSYFYNSQASPELTRAFNSLQRDGLINLKGEMSPGGEPKLMSHVISLTPEGKVFAENIGKSKPLLGEPQGTIFGAASQQAKQIFLNSPAFRSLSTPDQISFIFAHEHAHVSFSKAKAGEYGVEAQALISRAEEWVKAASPEAKANVEAAIRDMAIPKGMSLKDIEGVLKNPNNEEWLANSHAMLAIGALHSANPKEMFAFLPRPIRDLLDWTVATMQRLVKGVTTWAKLGFSLDQYQQVKTMESYFDAVRRSFREAEFDAAEAARFLELGNPGMRQGQAENFLLAQDTTGRPKFMTEPRQFLGTTWQKFVMGMGNLGRMYPVLQPAVDAVRKANDVKMDVNAHIMKIMYGTMSGTGKVLMDSPSLERVVGSPALKKLWNDMSTNAEKEGLNPLEMREQADGTVEMVFNDKGMSPELRGRLKQFKPEAQKALLETMANHQRANMSLQKFLVEFEKHGATALIANAVFSLPSQKNKAGFEGAYDRAAGLFDGVLNGDQVKIQEAVKGLSEEEATTAVEMAKVYAESNAELKAFYDSRPSYMSLRRFKEFRQRIVDKQGNRDVIDAASTTELNKVLKKYLDAGWVLEGVPLRSSDKAAKEAFHVNDAVRDILERKEKRVRDFVELSNIPDDIKADLMKQFNFVGELEHQVNAQSMYKPGTGRNFTGDLSRFDVLEQFMHSVPASISAASNASLNARVNFELRHPELQMQRTQKDQFLALFEQSKKTDGAFWKEMNRANAAFHIGLNFPGHLAEGFQPFLSHIPELRAQGATQWQAMKMIGRAQNEVFRMYGKIAKEKIWKPADVQVKANGKDYDGIPAMWYRANEGKAADAKDIMDMLADNISRVQRAPLADLFEATGREQRKLLDLMEGNRFQTTAEALAAPVHKYEQSVMGLYSNFTQHNGLLALIPAYRQGRANGLTHEQAKLEAARFDLATNNSGGRLERPEMFGKLGDAGHVVYALSSYVRGRFAQLATYYKHGWSEHFKGEEASLTPKQRQDAKAAFKNMILAQVGAAGILGLPFVGAGIALMEEMLDEDLKGKMLKGLEDALGDPVLTRVASHGAAAAFAESAGIPADLHSRFALSSFMGVNSYDGVSAKSFLGPMASMANSLFNMGGSLARGEGPINALAKGGPGGVRRFAEALTDQFRQENPEMNMTASALGFRSADMVKRKEWESIVRNQEAEANARKKLAAEEIKKAMKMGPVFARKALMEQAVKLLPETKNPLERQNALKGIIQGLTSRVQALAADEVAPRDYQGTFSQAVRPQAMEVARAMGMPQSQPMELARALAGQQARGILGRGFSMPAVRNAAERQQQWDPFNVGY
jgi:hypothetical protein